MGAKQEDQIRKQKNPDSEDRKSISIRGNFLNQIYGNSGVNLEKIEFDNTNENN